MFFWISRKQALLTLHKWVYANSLIVFYIQPFIVLQRCSYVRISNNANVLQWAHRDGSLVYEPNKSVVWINVRCKQIGECLYGLYIQIDTQLVKSCFRKRNLPNKLIDFTFAVRLTLNLLKRTLCVPMTKYSPKRNQNVWRLLRLTAVKIRCVFKKKKQSSKF